ncbi:MAG: hypothetical protein WC250_01475 [Candidatus Paceibacterota bacterium]|jgi:hypothetical protein
MGTPRKAAFYLRTALITIFVLFIAGYAFYQSKNLREGPLLMVDTPLNGSLATTSLITIAGTAKNITAISLNGRAIYVDETGHFDEKLLLSYGYNIITLSAKDKFGRSVSKKLELVYK